MANRYSQNFTLTDIFNNQRLKYRLPLINYKDEWSVSGVRTRTTHGKTVNTLIYDTAVKSARPYYKPLVAHRSGDTVEINGTLVGDYNTAYDAVYNGLVGIKEILKFTANNADMIRDALKEAERNKRKTGVDSVLYLRTQSMEQVAGMTRKQLVAFMDNVMENIMFSDDYPETQAKYKVERWNYKDKTYVQKKEEWERKVGIL